MTEIPLYFHSYMTERHQHRWTLGDQSEPWSSKILKDYGLLSHYRFNHGNANNNSLGEDLLENSTLVVSGNNSISSSDVSNNSPGGKNGLLLLEYLVNISPALDGKSQLNPLQAGDANKPLP